MALNPYLNFQGNCREAVMFYAEVFKTERPTFMSFGDMPPDPDFQLPEEAKSLIMHTNLNICGSLVMFSDVFPGMPYTVGNHISIAIVLDDESKIRQLFQRLKEGGTVEMDLQETQWSKCYGSLVDKFGISWQVNLQEECKSPIN